ncbi:hypothetical protein DES44_2943 [Roseateles depolymerans]|uniref:ORF031 protein n=1 Tax=Roseateles depolymerans TaxID=76731 RepID=Q9F215_9BURK|nr:hypothetical protein RD2015_1040 [Roseateles depolymerans]REG14447.1 hypothetical protein DES44_2943 [Roseateles depolymerans]BAB19663.1 ORF031 [Roseateles depolymerans]
MNTRLAVGLLPRKSLPRGSCAVLGRKVHSQE